MEIEETVSAEAQLSFTTSVLAGDVVVLLSYPDRRPFRVSTLT